MKITNTDILCSFCKEPIADMYKTVEGKIECIKCYVWLNLFKQKKVLNENAMQKSA